MHISYYITSHGFGHGVRACTIIDKIPADLRVTVHTALPEQFLREEISREFDYHPQEFDCGCLQSDSVTVDIEKTVRTYSAMAEKNDALLDNQAAWSRDKEVRVIVGDIPPFAFEIASRARIFSIAATNFTWLDIYESYVDRFPEFAGVVEHIQIQYQSANLLLSMAPSCSMPYFAERIDAGVVGRKGRNRRELLQEELSIDSGKRLALIYPGTFGLSNTPWVRLAEFDQWEFLGLYPLSGAPPNYHQVSKEMCPYQDLTASVDLVISKLGYSTVAECMINGTPLLYLPRTDFMEYPVLKSGVDRWGYGYCLPEQAYKALAWKPVLETVPPSRSIPTVDAGGAHRCAMEISSIARKQAL